MEGDGKVGDPLESSAARLLGQVVAAPGWTKPATCMGEMVGHLIVNSQMSYKIMFEQRRSKEAMFECVPYLSYYTRPHW